MEAAAINSGRREARRVNVVYFLSRDGRVEHPHLIQIHRFRRDRVRLRDVKRWLSEVRGEEMPETFSWSYKRRFRGGYIWQDLTENDIITPVADDEYVLKGSELIPIASKKEAETKSAHSLVDADRAVNAQAGLPPRREEQISQKLLPSAEIEPLDEWRREMAVILKEGREAGAGDENKRGGCYRRKNNRKKAKLVLFLNILGCKPACQNLDDALKPASLRRQGKKQASSSGEGNSSNGCTGGGGNMWRKAAYKQPAAQAACSQCGKPFKPPKMHFHMQSCRGFA